LFVLPDRLPQTFRNRNLLVAGCQTTGFAILAIVVNAVSVFGLGVALGLVLIAFLVALAIVYFVRWQRDVLVVTSEGISIGGIGRSVSVAWSAIDHFEIREPRSRSMTMVHFSPGADRVQVNMRDGSWRWISAIQPYHGFTIFSYFALASNTKADEVVDWLNRVRLRAEA
jgi:hypothetical protein